MHGTNEAIARLTLSILDEVNGADSEEAGIGICDILIDFLETIKRQRTDVYLEGIDYSYSVIRPDRR